MQEPPIAKGCCGPAARPTARRQKPTIALTRSRDDNARSASVLRALGARPLLLPVIRIVPAVDQTPLAAAISRLNTYRWVVFTSAHAVAATCGRADWPTAWEQARGSVRIAAVGAATSLSLAGFGLTADVVASSAGAERLASALLAVETESSGVRILWPRSSIAADDLARLLNGAGAVVDAPEAYRTVAERHSRISRFVRLLQGGRISGIAFCSPSAARGLADAIPGHGLSLLVGRTIVGSVGHRTTVAVEELGARVDVEATDAHASALLAALVERVSLT